MAKPNYMELKGVVFYVGKTQTFASGFTKKEIVVEIESGKYPVRIPVVFKKEKTKDLDGYKVGDAVEVSFFVQGSSWQKDKTAEPRFFAELAGWEIKNAGEDADGSTGSTGPEEVPDNDEMPF